MLGVWLGNVQKGKQTKLSLSALRVQPRTQTSLDISMGLLL